MKVLGKYLQPPTSTVANLPTLTSAEAGATLWCSDYPGGASRLIWSGAAWNPIYLRFTRTYIVDQGGKGDFTTIAAAFAYIATLSGGAIPSSTNRYLVQAGPGTYAESFTVPPYVGFKGSGRKSTIITGQVTVNGDTSIEDFYVLNVNNGIYDSVLFDFSTPTGSARTSCTSVSAFTDYSPSGVNQVVSAFAVIATNSAAVHIADMTHCWGYARNRVAAGGNAFAASYHWKSGSLYGQFEITHCSGKTSMNSPSKSAFARNSEAAFSSVNGGLFMGSNAYYAVNDTNPYMTYNASSDQYVMNNSALSFYGDVSIPSQLYTNFGPTTNASMPFNAPLVSTLATGTAPAIIASRTLVSNLNVELLNGQPGSFYTNQRRPKAKRVTGLLYPLYRAITSAFTDTDLNTLLDQCRRYPDVPLIVFANTASSGPGTVTDANVDVVTKRLQAAGAVIIGYVDTNYGAKSYATVMAEVAMWKTLYPQTVGIMFDRSAYAIADNTTPLKTTKRAYYKSIRQATEALGGYTTLIFNSGAPLLVEWFSPAAGGGDDVFGDTAVVITTEGTAVPSEATMTGFVGDEIYFDIGQRGFLLHDQTSSVLTSIPLILKYHSYIGFFTDSVYQVHPSFHESVFRAVRVFNNQQLNSVGRYTIAILPSLPAEEVGALALCTDLTGGEGQVRWTGTIWQRIAPHPMRETITTPGTIVATTVLGTASRSVRDPKTATLYDGAIAVFSFQISTVFPIGWSGTGNKTITWKPSGYTGTDAVDPVVSSIYLIEYQTLEVF